MKLLETAMKCPKCVVSVMGDHAGEDVAEIFNRKKADIDRLGLTFWLMRSPKARPPQVQELTKTIPTYTIFVKPATKGGARPTTEEVTAKEFSSERKIWNQLPGGLSPVTGKLDRCAAALVFDLMSTDIRGVLDLWEYADAKDINNPLKFILGCSTVCAVRKDTKLHPGKMKSRYREIVAVARLTNPYCVWVR
jgi:hypothetical protein